MKKVGLVYDPIYLEHDTGSHPENFRRLEYILEALDDYGIRDRMVEIGAEEASVEQVAMFHGPAYIEKVARFAQQGGGYLDPDTVVSSKSYEAALMAAGGVTAAVDSVIEGTVDSAFALVRPPGHHAKADRSMGFCLFNNVVIGAIHARKTYGIERILIVDWDVHHGNGIAEAFHGDPGVLYFSTHQQGIFPHTGSASDAGSGAGEGYTINVPLNRWTGDSGLYIAFTQILEPVARQFKPQLIMVSAGFDAHYADPLAGLEMTIGGYARLAEIVKRIAASECGGRIVAALEGGYNLGVVGHAVSAVVNVFGEYGVKVEEPGGTEPRFEKPVMRIPIDEAIKIQRKYWKL
ncbi:histone deacetylase family protein [Phosphitispora fastidiosa]|uniref:histone deacetylase family protein n=1 Tax=Phosphitispora fastidiosa TaxID=2837202 RepID=UPI001E4EE76D|nr:histone deacetylase [Phosphitispora fastidiosa]MBU7006626.1 acetoin utilization deacetylase AcuC-like enzyme [Phosphitispora fastidiosa]